MTTLLPTDFHPINARDGIMIEKPGLLYEVMVDGKFYGSAADIMDAMTIVETARSEKRAN